MESVCRRYGAELQALEEEYHRRFWERKLEFYVQLCRAAAELATSTPRSDEFKQKTRALEAFSVSELQLVASPEVDAAFGALLRVLGSFQAGKSGTAELYAALASLAITCRQDSAKELQLDPKEQREFEENARIMAKLFEDFVSKAPVGIRISPE